MPGAAGDDSLSYAEAFPPLPTAPAVANNDGVGAGDALLPASPTGSVRNQWGKKMSLRLSTTTQVASLMLYNSIFII